MSEIEELSKKFGKPKIYNFKLEALAPFSPPFDSRHSKTEIVLVLRNSDGKIWLHRKSYYPKDTLRLHTGGVETSESVYDALRRELKEETSLEKDPDKFLAIINYRLNSPKHNAKFVDYLFLFNNVDTNPQPLDETENIEEIKLVGLNDFPSVVNILSRQPHNSPNTEKQIGFWADWGRFRAISHNVVFNLLRE